MIGACLALNGTPMLSQSVLQGSGNVAEEGDGKNGRVEGTEECWEMLSPGCDTAFIHELAESVVACLRPKGLHKASQCSNRRHQSDSVGY